MNGDRYLASYPKSGNTWLRILLANLIADDPTPRPLNDLGLPTADAHGRDRFDDLMGLDSADLTSGEIQRLLPRFLERLSAQRPGGRGRFIKLHYANRAAPGEELIAAGGARKAVYLVRNPLSVTVSLAHHLATTPEGAAAHLADERFGLASDPGHLSRALPQWLGSWSTHVLSWLEAKALPVLVVRYEDLWTDTAGTLTRVASFLGLDDRLHRVPQAVAFSDLDRLRGAEESQGFRERPRAMARFFRQGGDGGWRDALPGPLVTSIVERHRPLMARLGYLPGTEWA